MKSSNFSGAAGGPEGAGDCNLFVGAETKVAWRRSGNGSLCHVRRCPAGTPVSARSGGGVVASLSLRSPDWCQAKTLNSSLTPGSDPWASFRATVWHREEYNRSVGPRHHRRVLFMRQRSSSPTERQQAILEFIKGKICREAARQPSVRSASISALVSPNGVMGHIKAGQEGLYPVRTRAFSECCAN